MIKVIQYFHGTSPALLEAACVAAWSIRQNGGLPADTRYILYTTTPENFENPFLYKIFDEVKEPTFDWRRLWNLDWKSRPIRESNQRIAHRAQMCFTKYLQWVEEPCSAEDYVIFHDMDILCLGSLMEALPMTEEQLWAAVPYLTPWEGRIRLGTNGGFYIKRGAFNQTDLPRQMQEMVWNDEKYSWTYHTLLPNMDESAVAYFFHYHGFSTFKQLDSRFNLWNVKEFIRKRKTLEQCDIRIMHYAAQPKPWDTLQKPYIALFNRWRNARDRMNETMKEEPHD